jgi:hypothetical protein
MTTDPLDLARLAHLIAARMTHDFAGPVSGVATGFDLLNSPGVDDLREDARALIQSSIKRLVNLLDFERAVHGAADAPIETSRLKHLAESLLEDSRTRIDWRIVPGPLPGHTSRILLALIQLAAQTSAGEGSITVESLPRPFRLRIIQSATKVRVPDEVIAGLRGEAPGNGMAGRWATAFLILEDVKSAAGSVTTRIEVDQFFIEATFADG